MSKGSLLPLLLLCLMTTVHAADPVVPTEGIIESQKAIRADLEARTGRFEDMPAVKRRKLAADQGKLLALLEGKTTTAELNPTELTEASNLQQSIHAAISKTEDERLVCERTRMTGSQRITRVCKSVAQIKAEHEASRDAMRDNRAIQTYVPSGGR